MADMDITGIARIRLGTSKVEITLAEHAFRVRMGDIVPVAVQQERVRLVFSIIRDLVPLVDDPVDLPHLRGQPVQRSFDAEDANDFALLVMEGDSIAAKHGLDSAHVEMRFRPVVFVCDDSFVVLP